MATSQLTRTEIDDRLIEYFDGQSDVDFVYRYEPLQGTGEPSITVVDLAICLARGASLTDCFMAKTTYYHDLPPLLLTSCIGVVTLNDCPYPYQELVYHTGTLLVAHNPITHQYFCYCFNRNKKKAIE